MVSNSKSTFAWTNYALAVGLAAAIMIGLADPAYASFTDNLTRRLVEAVKTARTLTYILAAFAIVVFAILAFFGKFSWMRLIYIIGGVILLAGSFELIIQLSEGFSGSVESMQQFQ